jgi:hypothetical protein
MSHPDPLSSTGIDEQRIRKIRERAYLLWEEAGCPEGQGNEFWSLAQQEISMQDASVDETLEEAFPASDPPADTVAGEPANAPPRKLAAKPRRR